MEKWKPIKGYENLYIVSNTGKIKTVSRTVQRSRNGCLPVKEKELAQYKDKYGYMGVSLQKDGKRRTEKVHRLVLMSFNPDCSGKQVNHKDGNKTNNNLENLEWVTPSENIKHAIKYNLRGHSHRPIIKIEKGEETYYESIKEAVIANNCSYVQMWRWLQGKPTRKGIIFKYE